MKTIKTIEKSIRIFGKSLSSHFRKMFANKEKKEFQRLKDFLTL